MYPYSYAISLCIAHPGIDSVVVSETLKLPCHPVAPTLHSYWRHRYHTPGDSGCAAFITNTLARLEQHAEFFQRIRAAGGKIEFFVGLASDKNFGDIFPHETLALLGRLQIDLSLDIYPGNQVV